MLVNGGVHSVPDQMQRVPHLILESSMDNQIFTNIKLTPQDIELVLTGLNQLARGQVETLFQNIVTQYKAEIKRMQFEATPAEDLAYDTELEKTTD
jgi:hypothetical protein